MKLKSILPLLKIIGVLLFGWILYNIDRNKLIGALSQTDFSIAAVSLLGILGIFIAKTLRWHTLTKIIGKNPTLKESWKIYAIGIFLGTITPAKIGELGKAAYLQKHGIPGKIGIALSIIDRITDVIAIGLVGILGIGVLISVQWALIIAGIALFAALISILIILRIPMVKIALPFVKLYMPSLPKMKICNIVLLTCVAWAMYFFWAVMLARSIGITIDATILVSAFTITGLLSMVPIAPSGLGTRDAALLILLAPFGVGPEQAIALALLMFVTILLMGIPGGYYWIRER